ncbi:hypothetical protein B0H16DRAFT_1562408 [Mycena metata]|uniref:F-box domain-containing protein n=1 Tax=Mycena metata TaxID=1033252 RepID=A0AAD7IH17_9AGAR|nr:hypothetical protein B0H16DRAFT_1562408 [Mycena metata]
MSDLPHEILETIVDQLHNSSLHPFSLVATAFAGPAQARIFRSLHIHVDGRARMDYRPMSPWQAQRLFSSSPHLALYVQHLSIEIPPPMRAVDPRIITIPARPTQCYPPLQAVLPSFTRVRRFVLRGPMGRRWAILPPDLKKALRTILLLPSLQAFVLSGLTVSPALITYAAARVPMLSLFGVNIEPATASSSSPAADVSTAPLQVLALQNVSTSMAAFLSTPGALRTVRDMSITLTDWPVVCTVLRGVARTLTHLRFSFSGDQPERRSDSSALPRLYALRLLEVESGASDTPYRLRDLVPSALPHLDKIVMLVSVTPELRREANWLSRASGGETAWSHDGRIIDLTGYAGEIHCRLVIHDYSSVSDPPEAWRELRDKVYEEFVRCMGEQMPAVHETGRLSFSQEVRYWLRK